MKCCASLSAALLLAACGGNGVDAGTEIPMREIASGQQSALVSYEGVVARTPAEWQAFWARHSAYTNQPLPLPPVNFNTEQVVGVMLGSRPSGCHTVAIRRALQSQERVTVRYQEVDSSGSTPCTLALVKPSRFVAIARSALPVVFDAD